MVLVEFKGIGEDEFDIVCKFLGICVFLALNAFLQKTPQYLSLAV
jgi:hypothetical protein